MSVGLVEKPFSVVPGKAACGWYHWKSASGDDVLGTLPGGGGGGW